MLFTGWQVDKDSHQRGASSVEFALILPLVILLIFALIDFGRLFFVQISLTSASREAVRISSLNPEGCVLNSSPDAKSDDTSSPCSLDGKKISESLYGEVCKVVAASSAGVEGLSQISDDSVINSNCKDFPNSPITVSIQKPCSITPSILETEVTIKVEFDWLLPIEIGSQPFVVKSTGYMKCLN